MEQLVDKLRNLSNQSKNEYNTVRFCPIGQHKNPENWDTLGFQKKPSKKHKNKVYKNWILDEAIKLVDILEK